MAHFNIFFVVLFAAGPGGTTLPDQTSSLRCRTDVTADLEKAGSLGKWQRIVDPELGWRAYRSPTKQLGHWVELQHDPEGVPKLVYYEPNQSWAVDFGKLCERKKSTLKALNAATGGGTFTDKDLASLLTSKRSGIIYVWSPGMVYSMKEMRLFQDFAKKYKIEFVPIVDEKYPANVVEKAIQTHSLPKSKALNAVELAVRGIAHYPTTFVFANGKISLRPIYGVKEGDELKVTVASRLAELIREEK